MVVSPHSSIPGRSSPPAFWDRRPILRTGPIYSLVADRYEGLLKIILISPIAAVLLVIVDSLPALVAGDPHAVRWALDMHEGAFVLDYNSACGYVPRQDRQGDARVEAVLQNTPDISGYIC